jgi:hypothetical protein
MGTVHKLNSRSAKAQLRCSACGADATASCDCGVAYLPAGKRAEEVVAANPEKSDRVIAEEIGVGSRDSQSRAPESNCLT